MTEPRRKWEYATIPLLKTLWLCKKDNKRVRLVLKPKPDEGRVEFEIERDVPVVGGNLAQRRAHDKQIGQGTMSRSGVYCPCCGKPGSVAMTMEDIRIEGKAGRLGAQMNGGGCGRREGQGVSSSDTWGNRACL